MTEHDGHWPVLVMSSKLEALVIACECGEQPKTLAKRMSMQHTWHQTHRRTLKLQPVEYEFPNWHSGEVSTGKLVQVHGHKWENGGWVKA